MRLPSVLIVAAMLAPLAAFSPLAPAIVDVDANLSPESTAASGASSEPISMLGSSSGAYTGAQRMARWASFEPTIGAKGGTLYFTAFTGALVTNWVTMQKSTDDGNTWVDGSPRVAGVKTHPQSNDPLLHLDTDTGRIFVLDMQGVQCAIMSFSDDEGATWTTNPKACGQVGGDYDHPTLVTAKPRSLPTIGYPNILYLCTNRVVDTECSVSLDGGLTFGPERGGIFYNLPDGTCLAGGLTGHLAAAPDGRVYIGAARCSTPMVSFSSDDGVTWTTKRVSSKAISGHDVEVSVDEAGNVYALFTSTDGLLYMVVSKDNGDSWGPAIRVTPAGVNTAEFHTIAAGADGRVAIAYYGTATDGDSNTFTKTTTWNAYLTISTDATSASPTFTTVSMNDPADPIARGACNDDNRCIDVGDFIDVVIDDAGRPWVALVDECIGLCVTRGNLPTTTAGAIGTLAAGDALRGPAGTPLAPLR